MRRSAPGCHPKATGDVSELTTEVMKWKRKLEGRKEKYDRYKSDEVRGVKSCERLGVWLNELKSKKLPCKVPDDWTLIVAKGRHVLKNIQRALAAYQRLIEEENNTLYETKDAITSAAPVKADCLRMLQKRETCDINARRIETEVDRYLTDYNSLDIPSLLKEAGNFQSSMTQDRFIQSQPPPQQVVQPQPVHTILPEEIRSEVTTAYRAACFPNYDEPFSSLDDAKERLRPYSYMPLLATFPGSEQAFSNYDCESTLRLFEERFESIEDEVHKLDSNSNNPPTATDSFIWESILRQQSQDRIRKLTNLLNINDDKQFLAASSAVQIPAIKKPSSSIRQNNRPPSSFGDDMLKDVGGGLGDLLKFNSVKRPKLDLSGSEKRNPLPSFF
eukprot:TRINITY_DN12700_c0_g1_i1.p1 TRINITY_DN12700_c0_g1~~TRINITY_DN12700_c0_g1_i1.p1  ORF type:complete len:388 (+),score=69.55 TRINITY_DN12700_c0_g1_i1:77-1240(+)